MLNTNQIYHLYNHANGSENLFRTDDNYLYFLQKYDSYINLIAYTFAYCLMPNHFHILVKIKDERSIIDEAFHKFETFGKLTLEQFISKQFSNFFSSYTQSYNKVYHRKGSLFVPNFKSRLIEDKTYLLNSLNYIHMNPVLHGFVKKPDEWKYSSYNAFFGNKATKVSREKVLESTNISIEDFKGIHNLKDAEEFSGEMNFFY